MLQPNQISIIYIYVYWFLKNEFPDILAIWLGCTTSWVYMVKFFWPLHIYTFPFSGIQFFKKVYINIYFEKSICLGWSPPSPRTLACSDARRRWPTWRLSPWHQPFAVAAASGLQVIKVKEKKLANCGADKFVEKLSGTYLPTRKKKKFLRQW